jgi:DNA-binding transcriptional LysR family regulator
MNIADIEAYVALAEAGSVNRAALKLNLTQPAVTRRIQAFEAAIGGAVLLDRRAKPSVLTPEGRRVLESCRHVLKALAELKSNAMGGPLSGEIRLGVAHGLAEMVLSTPIDSLRQRYPNIRPRVTSHWTTWLIEQIRNGTLDCAIGLLADDRALPSAVHSVAIGAERVAIVAGPDVAVPAGRGQLRLKDLAEANWILNPEGCGYRDAIQQSFDRLNMPLRIVAEILGHELQLSLIARGAGLGLVPRRQIDSSPHRRHLRILKLKDFDLKVAIAMLHGGSLGRLAPVIEHFQAQVHNGLQKYAKRA